MTDNRKISEIYNETITAIINLKKGMTLEERSKIYDTINKNKKSLGVVFNPYFMSYDKIKEFPIFIHYNIEMASRGRSSTSLEDLRMKLEEEPSFLEQFNF